MARYPLTEIGIESDCILGIWNRSHFPLDRVENPFCAYLMQIDGNYLKFSDDKTRWPFNSPSPRR